MTDNSNVKRVRFSNAKLAGWGLFLSALYPCVVYVLFRIEKPLYDYLRQNPDGTFYWKQYDQVVKGVFPVLYVVFVAFPVGLGMIMFAIYRAYHHHMPPKRMRWVALAFVAIFLTYRAGRWIFSGL